MKPVKQNNTNKYRPRRMGQPYASAVVGKRNIIYT